MRIIFAVNFLREDQNVLVVRSENHAVMREVHKVLGGHHRLADTDRRYGREVDIIRFADLRYTRILDTERFK